MKINKLHRKKLEYYLKQFYKFYPNERYTLFHFVRYFKKRLKHNNKDAWIGVCGETGGGKSFFVLMSMILFGRRMDLDKNVAYIPHGDEIEKKFDRLNLGCLLIDEAAKEMRSVNWQSKKQQGVNVKAMTDRFKRNMVFLNMPNFNEFTKSMRKGNLQFRAILLYRNKKYARIVIQRKSKNWRADDPWCDAEASKIYEKIEKKNELDDDKILEVERNLSSTIMDFIVPNLEIILPDVTTEYQRLKEESRKIQKIEEKKNAPDKYKKIYQNFLSKISKVLYSNSLGLGKRRVPMGDIAKAMGVSSSTFKKYLNQKEHELGEKKKDSNPITNRS